MSDEWPPEVVERVARDRAAREAVQQGQPGLFVAMSEAMFRHNLIGINFGSNTDEYDAEAGTVIPRLAGCSSAGDVEMVLHEEFVRWFPYCSQCLAHARMIDEADEKAEESIRLRHESRASMTFAQAAMRNALLAAGIALVILGTMVNADNMRRDEMVTPIVSILVIGGGFAAYFLVKRQTAATRCNFLTRRLRAAESERADLIQQAEESCLPDCSCLGAAAVYGGWDHSIQSFAFASQEYANRVCRANRNKVVS